MNGAGSMLPGQVGWLAERSFRFEQEMRGFEATGSDWILGYCEDCEEAMPPSLSSRPASLASS